MKVSSKIFTTCLFSGEGNKIHLLVRVSFFLSMWLVMYLELCFPLPYFNFSLDAFVWWKCRCSQVAPVPPVPGGGNVNDVQGFQRRGGRSVCCLQTGSQNNLLSIANYCFCSSVWSAPCFITVISFWISYCKISRIWLCCESQ